MEYKVGDLVMTVDTGFPDLDSVVTRIEKVQIVNGKDHYRLSAFISWFDEDEIIPVSKAMEMLYEN